MAFDFSKVKTFAIPEGKVKSLVVGGKTVWRAGAWTTYTIQANASGGDTYIISSNDYSISNGVYTIGGANGGE